LERLANHAATHGPISSARSGGAAGADERQAVAAAPPFQQLPLYVAPINLTSTSTSTDDSSSGSSSTSGGSSGGFELREGMGCLQVPVTAEAHRAYGFVMVRGCTCLATGRGGCAATGSEPSS